MIVRWAEVVGFPGYEVSNDGRVRKMWKTRSPMELKIQPHADCRFGVVRMLSGGNTYQRSLKQLVETHHNGVGFEE